MEITRRDDPNARETVEEGIERRVLAFDDDLMLVEYTVRAGASFPAHEHEVTHQAVYVLGGEVELFGEASATLSTGDSFVVGPGTVHGVRGVAPESRLLDAFAPPIEEYAPD